MNHDFFLYLGIGAVVVAVLSFIILSKIIKWILRIVAVLILIGIVQQCSASSMQKRVHDQFCSDPAHAADASCVKNKSGPGPDIR